MNLKTFDFVFSFLTSLTLLVIDGTSGTLDPAFEAHAPVIRHWALAVWDQWFLVSHMQETLSIARHKLAHARD